MKSLAHQPTVSIAALATALLAAPAFAQDAPAGAQPASPPVSGALSQAQTGDDIVVTAAVGDRTRFKSSVSVSQVSNEAIQNFTPRSQAEILRSIPGIQTAANAGPGGNANIGVRGIPVSTGGSEYVALQEDGLPVVLFGDINFGNNDYWLRFDYTVDRVEAVRGGSASTFASQAPGAVINYISNTGDHDGGSIGYTEGLDFRQHQLNFNYGGHIDPTLRYDIGGYWRRGAGPSDISYDALKGYQVKANITKELPDNRGYIRLLFKRLDEQAPTNTSSLAIAKLDGNKITGFDLAPGIDPREGSTYSENNRRFQYVDQNGNLQSAKVEGIHPRVTSVGAQIHYEIADGITIDDNFRKSWISGSFTTQFLNVLPTSSLIGSTVNGQTVGAIRYANGPNQGKTFTGQFVNNNPNINTLMHDMGNLANNLQINGKHELGSGTVNLSAGWFHMSQKIDQTWFVNRQYSEIATKNGAELDLFSTTGTQLTAAGQAGYGDNWGTCCARNVDLTYTDDAPFLSAGYSVGGLNLDGSVRFDRVAGKGFAQGGVAGANYTVSDALGTAVIPSLIAASAKENINYLKSYSSWSAGALYAFGSDTSVFVRASRGGRFNADRRVLGGNFNSDGSLNAQGNSTAVNFLNQQEAGLKQRGTLSLFGMTGRYTTETTFFHSTLTENNYDFTRLANSPPNNNPNISNKYRSFGVEFTGNIAMGNFHLTANLTYTDAKIKDSATAAIIGNRPGGIPRLQYFIQPSYDRGIAAVGFTIDGQTGAPIDDFGTYELNGTTFVNAFLKIRPVKNLELGINVNNLFNTLGFRYGGNVVQSGGTSYYTNTGIYGRTTEASIRFRF
ncbi:TonB-dependent receptor domain-containing protein [Sphingomonas nostoxanthinifaciens]|uniref:TonB-dependent receptor domain-containing protein n=1 Tax=Sphingomonas nostoxanthinifaciens TaxID=2872652 RepID=UPI001CC1FB96|nr:TonB-dependent receptor [Sphingomonas nostoxanthinifaciens]UAK23154.1 TonB-dependent receptor [Sphingomonas nostoxanthinifaciens]